MVFPAHAGMSPILYTAMQHMLSFPRSRGDEPVSVIADTKQFSFSPLTRG